ncbi:MAG: hypothetical protein DRP78_05585 [Candidatus Omnitrophota bacterium]|nr:MAG: hypothetical protein DRP78_05585 [Candidatus Omnitrophota bacterium]
MATITGTVAIRTEFSGKQKVVVLTAPIESASDVITISLADHGISSITAIIGCAITGGLDAAFSYIQVTKTNSTTLTISSFEQDGTAATDFTGTTVSIGIIGQ